MNLNRTIINYSNPLGNIPDIEIDVVHNLIETSFDICEIFEEWKAQTKSFTTASFCRFVMLKDIQNIVCMKYIKQ